MGQLALSIAVIEGQSFPAGMWLGKGNREPGDLGFLPYGNAAKFKKDLNTLKLNELKNGRLAMIAMAAFFSEHVLDGSVPLLPSSI